MVVHLKPSDFKRLGPGLRQPPNGAAMASSRGGRNRVAVDGAILGRAPKTPYLFQEFSLFLDVPPQPKERARTFMSSKSLASAFLRSKGDLRRFMASIRGNGDTKSMMRTWTPEATRQFETMTSLLARQGMIKNGLKMFVCPVELDVSFLFVGDAMTWPTAHNDGDLDNLEKSLKDALIGVVYADDRLVVRKRSEKICSIINGIFLRVTPAAP